MFEADRERSPRLYILVVGGEADSVMASWYATEVEAPAHLEVATHEWPGHGSREQEPLMSTVDDLGADVFEAFREAMSIGHFIMCGHSAGALVLTYVCERAKRELGVAPQAVLVIDRGPPHLPVFTDYGQELLLREPERWLAMWRPDIYKYWMENKISQVAYTRWITDMQLENDTRLEGWYRFPCRVTAVVALDTFTKFPPLRSDPEWIEERIRCTRTGKGFSFELHDFDEWSKWAEDVWVYELPTVHEDAHRHAAFKDLLWSEADRVLEGAA